MTWPSSFKRLVPSQPGLTELLHQCLESYCDRRQESQWIIYLPNQINIQKSTTNLSSLQRLIDVREAAFAAKKSTSASSNPGVEESEETYVQSTLPVNRQTYPNEQKVLGVPWNVSHDQLVFNLEGIMQNATHIDPTKRNVVSMIRGPEPPWSWWSV